MQTSSMRLSEILRRAKEKSLVIPQFQRPFVWSESQVKLLIDSVSRNYPIGSILLLAKSPSISLASRSIEAEIKDGIPPSEIIEAAGPEHLPSEHFYILDGQQRITSIVRVFMSSHPKKDFYFDLSKLIQHDHDDDSGWVITRQKGKNTPERKDKNKLLRSDLILDQTKCDIYVSEYLEDSDEFSSLGKDERRWKGAAIKGIFEIMRNYQVPVITIERDAQIESICRIFETINSTGTRLTTFDLAVAKFYPEPDLRQMWDDAREDDAKLRMFEVDGERAMQVIALVLGWSSKKFIEATRSAILSLPPETITEMWPRAIGALKWAYDWTYRAGARNRKVPGHGIVTTIAAAKLLCDQTPNLTVEKSREFEQVITRWFFCKGLQSGARAAGNYKMAVDFQNLTKFVEQSGTPIFDDVELDVDAIANLTSAADVRYTTLEMILFRRVRECVFTGDPIDYTNVEIHHIFPRAFLKKKNIEKKRVDSVANLLPVSEKANRALSDKDPAEYFEEMFRSAEKNGTTALLDERLRAALLPASGDFRALFASASDETFVEFVQSRSEKILSDILVLVGNSHKVRIEGEPHDA